MPLESKRKIEKAKTEEHTRERKTARERKTERWKTRATKTDYARCAGRSTVFNGTDRVCEREGEIKCTGIKCVD